MLFKEFLLYNKDFFNKVRLIIVPNKSDFGLKTFPRQEIPRFYLEDLLTQFKFIVLTENPFKFIYQNKVVLLIKTDQANTILRDSIIPIDQTKDTIELMSNTIIF